MAGVLLSACSSDEELDPVPCSSSTFTELLVNAGVDGQSLAGLCMARSVTPNAMGQVDCVVLEGRKSAACDCAQPGRKPVAPEHAPLIDELAEQDVTASCFCEIEQLQGDALSACQSDPSEPLMIHGGPVSGWCAIDATTTPPIGNPELVAGCPEVERRFMRMVGEIFQEPSTLAVACHSGDLCADG